MTERAVQVDVGRQSAAGLVIVGTPLGNLSDLSSRGRDALSDADLIACEDSRRTGRLLSHLNIGGAKMVVVNEHTEVAKTDRIIESIREGMSVALVSDAGMPTISDPGHRLVAATVAANLSLGVVPGPTAAMATLAVSGLPADRFVFEGFLPRKGAERKRRLQGLADERRTAVLYEAPHRISKTLNDLLSIREPTTRVCIGRELTKLFEEVIHGSLSELQVMFADKPAKGEFVIVLAGVGIVKVDAESLTTMLERCRLRGLSRRDAVAEVTESSGGAKGRIYDLALGLDF